MCIRDSVMDLVDENRIIVKYGLHALAKINHPGLQAVIRHSGLNSRDVYKRQS